MDGGLQLRAAQQLQARCDMGKQAGSSLSYYRSIFAFNLLAEFLEAVERGGDLGMQPWNFQVTTPAFVEPAVEPSRSGVALPIVFHVPGIGQYSIPSTRHILEGTVGSL